MASATEANDIETLENKLLGELATAKSLGALEEFRVGALGKKGRIPALMKTLGGMAPEERKSFGQAVNGLKQRVTAALESRKAVFDDAALTDRLAKETVDITLPVRHGPEMMGRIHPISQAWDELTEIFADMGFSVAEGPDIETEEHNFDKLNIPPSHPARQEMDTFYLRGSTGGDTGGDAPRKVLRTHTSPVQIRTMESQDPPIRIIAPGRVYRSDSDQTHTPMFHQVEGLVIDESTHMGHLKWCLEEFCKAFFEVDSVKMKFRASHFPFTEPSMEVDIGYAKVGDEIRIGEGDQWMEILGCGMVHPNVLRNVGYDPDKYQGWAFGVGIDRIATLKYGMPDLRPFFTGDLRWLRHYGFLPFDVPTLAGGLSS